MSGGGASDTRSSREAEGYSNYLRDWQKPLFEELMSQFMAVLKGGAYAIAGGGTGFEPQELGPDGKPIPFTMSEGDLYRYMGETDPGKRNDIQRWLKEQPGYTPDKRWTEAEIAGLELPGWMSPRSKDAAQGWKLAAADGFKSGARRSGGGGAISALPILTSALEQSKQAGSRAMEKTRGELAAGKLGGSPFAENILAQQKVTSAQQTAGIPAQIAEKFITMAANAALGLPTNINQGYGISTSAETDLEKAKMAQQAALWQAIGSAVGGISQSAGQFLGAKWGGSGKGGGGGGGSPEG